MIRVVIDTNVVISALLNPFGFPSAVLHTVVTTEKIEWFVSNEILTEYEEVLQRPKFDLDPQNKIDFIRFIKGQVRLIEPKEVVTILNDKADNRFLECALASKAHFLITGNRKDFSMMYFETTKIVSPRDFIEIILSV